jgi:hypothetical protein
MKSRSSAHCHARGGRCRRRGRALTSVARSAAADLVVVGRSVKMLHRLAGSVGRRLASCPDAPVTVGVP